jgi:PAS domain S-box-containing protein
MVIKPESLRGGLTHEEALHLLDSLKAIVWRGDPDTYCFTYVSREAESLLGYPIDNWIGDPKFWADHMHPEDRAWALDFCVHHTQALTDHEFEYRMIAADGRTVWLKDIVHLVVEDGTPKESVGLMIDITDKKRAEAYERQLETNQRQRDQALELNDAVVQGLATAKMALEMEMPEKVQEALAQTLQRAREIVSHLLENRENGDPSHPV